MYDESIQRAAHRAHVRPIIFEHPLQERVLSLFEPGGEPTSVVEGTSEIALGEKGAERLLGRGHLLAKLEGSPLVFAQVPFAQVPFVDIHFVEQFVGIIRSTDWATA